MSRALSSSVLRQCRASWTNLSKGLRVSAVCSEKFKRNRGTGDKGQSSLYNLERRWKDDAVFEALGSTDELSSILGICREHLKGKGHFDLVEKVTKTQCCLQDLGSHIATPAGTEGSRAERTKLPLGFALEVNAWVDQYAAPLPPLKTFILPGGGETAATLHLARTACRRAERRVAALLKEEQVDETALIYLNRLSDLLFVLARYVCFGDDEEEISYQKPKQAE